MSGSAPGWVALAAGRSGSVHRREHRPMQDSSRTSTDEHVTVAAVADGHGHHLHFRSDVGADLATRTAVDVVRAAAAGWTDRSTVERSLPHLVEDVVDAWVAGVVEHATGEGDPEPALEPYGTTLLVAAATTRVVVLLQVGDGDLVAADRSGDAWRPLPDDPRHDGVHTASLCQPDARTSFRCAVLDADAVALVYLCSDGFGAARVDADGWWRETGRQLVELTGAHGPAWVADQLPAWLEEPAEVGGDDTTLALVVRSSGR